MCFYTIYNHTELRLQGGILFPGDTLVLLRHAHGHAIPSNVFLFNVPSMAEFRHVFLVIMLGCIKHARRLTILSDLLALVKDILEYLAWCAMWFAFFTLYRKKVIKVVSQLNKSYLRI